MTGEPRGAGISNMRGVVRVFMVSNDSHFSFMYIHFNQNLLFDKRIHSYIFDLRILIAPVDKHVAPLWHVILIPSQQVFALAPRCCVLSGEATNTNCIVFGLIRPGLEPTIDRTRGEHANHCTLPMRLSWFGIALHRMASVFWLKLMEQ